MPTIYKFDMELISIDIHKMNSFVLKNVGILELIDLHKIAILNSNTAIFQLYHGENSILRIDMSSHSDTLS